MHFTLAIEEGRREGAWACHRQSTPRKPPATRTAVGRIYLCANKLRQTPYPAMPTYLLACKCGKSTPVEVGQAGGQVVCDCGERLDVPTLRQLRHLPQVQTAAAPAARGGRDWNVRKGVIAASLVAVAVLTAIVAWSRWTEPTIPKFDPAVHTKGVDERLRTQSPAQAWEWWIEYYKPLAQRGFPVFQSPNEPAIQIQIAKSRFLQKSLLAVAGLAAVVGATAALWPREKSGRPGVKKTRRER
jgi:hypothetical protein